MASSARQSWLRRLRSSYASLAVEEHLQPGQVISGRFRLEKLLGQGGMGTVWEARHLSLETQIAIKFLNPDLSRRHDVLARFAREATSAARISSPHVVSILDSGFTDDGRGFIAMELLRGEDLGRRLARLGTLTLSETARLVAQVSRGLAKAHAVGVVHRDLKPENIFVLDEDDTFTVKILDFGIAKSIGPEAATHKTDTGQLLGTPLYMSPEQALGRPIDNRSDLYSLAVVAYRCLAGRPPFTHDAVGELIVAVSTHATPPPSEFNPDLSAEVDAWFVAALAKDPSARCCQKAGEVADSFARACGNGSSTPLPSSDPPRVRPSRPPPRRNDTEETPVPSAEEVATTLHAGQLPLAVPQRTRWRTSALVAVFALAAATVAFQMRSPSPESNAQTAPLPAKPRLLTPTLDPARASTADPSPPPSPSTAATTATRSIPRATAAVARSVPVVTAIPTSTAALQSEVNAAPTDTVIAAPVAAAPTTAPPKKSGPTLDREDPWHQADAGP